YLLNDSQHTLRNAIIRGKSTFAVRLTGNTIVKMDNVLLENAGRVQIQSGASLEAQHLSSWNSPWKIAQSAVTLNLSAIAGPDAAVNIDQPLSWSSDYNLWDVQSFIWNGKTYDKSTFV